MTTSTNKPPIGVNTGFAGKVLSNQKVLNNMPAFKRLADKAKSQGKGCCGGQQKDPAYQEAVNLIKTMPDSELNKLRELMDIDPDRKFVYFEKDGKKYTRRER